MNDPCLINKQLISSLVFRKIQFNVHLIKIVYSNYSHILRSIVEKAL